MDLEDWADLEVPEDREDLEVPLDLADLEVLAVPAVLLQEERETSQFHRMVVREDLMDPEGRTDLEVLAVPAVLEVRMDQVVLMDLAVRVGHLHLEARDYLLEVQAVQVNLEDQVVLKVPAVLEDQAVQEVRVVREGLHGLHLQLLQLLFLLLR